MSREKGKVNPKESRPEVNLTGKRGDSNTESLFPPVVNTEEYGKYSTS
jgi:hypothetical protein